MRARALEMDSHHDCIGSWLMGLELEFASVEVEDDGEPDACFTWNSMAADDDTGVDGALGFSAKKRIYLNKGLHYFLSYQTNQENPAQIARKLIFGLFD